MVLEKHIKLLRKFLGNLTRSRFGWQKKFTKFVKFFYLLIEWPFELVGDVLFLRRRFGEKKIENPRRILIVKIDQFGDVLFSTFLLPIIKKKYPKTEIDYLINPKTKALLEGNPYITNVFFWEDMSLLLLGGREKSRTGGFSEIRKKNHETLRMLRARHYDAVINTRAYPPSSNIPWCRIGSPLISFDISEQSFLADHWASYDLDEEEWKNYLNLLVPLGIDISSAHFSEEFYNHDAPNPMKDSGKYIVVSPVSFDASRELPKESWRRIASFMISRGMHIALTGMPPQKNYLEDIAVVDKDKIKVFTEMRLPEFGALMKNAEFFVGIDSFPAHLALASGKRAVVLINPGTWYLKGYSRKRFAVDARNMLPVVPEIDYFDIQTASLKDIEKAIKVLIDRNL